MSDGGDERRDAPRAPIVLRVEYEKVNTFFYDYTRNISKGGTFIQTERPLPVGTEFLFKLVIPLLEQPLTIRGKVQWVGTQPHRRNGEMELGMGIQFVYESGAARGEVEARVERLMVEQLGELACSKLMGSGAKSGAQQNPLAVAPAGKGRRPSGE